MFLEAKCSLELSLMIRCLYIRSAVNLESTAKITPLKIRGRLDRVNEKFSPDILYSCSLATDLPSEICLWKERESHDISCELNSAM